MSEVPKISVVMPVYNDEAFVRKAIESILAQTFGKFELIIINDGSTDSSPSIISSFADPRVRIVHNKGNLGLPVTLNRGIRLARGQYVARQDADDVALPKRLELQNLLLDCDPSIALVGCSWIYMDMDGDEFGSGTIPGDDGSIKEALVNRNEKFPHGCLMFRKKILDCIGGYDERFLYTQDLDLQLRLLNAGHGFGGVNMVLYKFRKNMEPDDFKSECQARFRALAYKRFYSRNEIEIPDVVTEVNALDTRVRFGSGARKAQYWSEVGRSALKNHKFRVARKHILQIIMTGDIRSSIKLIGVAILVSSKYILSRGPS